MCFGSDTEEEKTDKRIKKEIEKQKKYMRSVIKLLLLGNPYNLFQFVIFIRNWWEWKKYFLQTDEGNYR